MFRAAKKLIPCCGQPEACPCPQPLKLHHGLHNWDRTSLAARNGAFSPCVGEGKAQHRWGLSPSLICMRVCVCRCNGGGRRPTHLWHNALGCLPPMSALQMPHYMFLRFLVLYSHSPKDIIVYASLFRGKQAETQYCKAVFIPECPEGLSACNEL